MRQFTLSILVPVYNEKFLVEESLTGLFVLKDSPQLEKIQVVVVDDGSTDGTQEILEKLRNKLPEISGNAVNGLNEADHRRPAPVAFRGISRLAGRGCCISGTVYKNHRRQCPGIHRPPAADQSLPRRA